MTSANHPGPPPGWTTANPTARILVVVHNVTAATRLLDVLPDIARDARVQLSFTCPRSSPFTAGTDEHLRSHGIEPVPWEHATHTEFDLAISASYGENLHEISAPIVTIPHGLGYNKYLKPGNRETGKPGNRETGKPGNRETGKPVFGLSEPWLLHDGNVVPAVIGLSHPEQLDRLHAACPEAAPAARILGDPCIDRLRASTPLRETYRQAFGLAPGQHLVLVTSTWGPDSLYGRRPDLALELARRLPLDEYRIALSLHPNIAAGHSPWQVRMWLDDCRRDGILVLPDGDHWMPATLASSLVVGDHGSTTFYAASQDIPVLLASAPATRSTPPPPSPHCCAPLRVSTPQTTRRTASPTRSAPTGPVPMAPSPRWPRHAPGNSFGGSAPPCTTCSGSHHRRPRPRTGPFPHRRWRCPTPAPRSSVPRSNRQTPRRSLSNAALPAPSGRRRPTGGIPASWSTPRTPVPSTCRWPT
ncbi:hypothetical protein BJF85_14605 [Saccharomonospora sp. CUA-673]|nr:hypothetical protein BJF85_14605 [Saccharomonospora sp. CUA-673]